jgi:hypothetical protein
MGSSDKGLKGELRGLIDGKWAEAENSDQEDVSWKSFEGNQEGKRNEWNE